MARFRDDLADLLPKAAALKRRLSDRGYMLTGEEPLKVTVCPKSFGYTGTEIAATLEENGAFPEFYDPDHVVLMLSPWTGANLVQHPPKNADHIDSAACAAPGAGDDAASGPFRGQRAASSGGLLRQDLRSGGHQLSAGHPAGGVRRTD